MIYFMGDQYQEGCENYSLGFDGLPHEMVSMETFINRDISYITQKGEINCSAITDYITENLNII